MGISRWVAVWCSVLRFQLASIFAKPVSVRFIVLQCAEVCCSGLQCVAVCCSAMQCVAMCCSVLQCVAFSIRLDICKTCFNYTHAHTDTYFIFEHIVVEFVGRR